MTPLGVVILHYQNWPTVRETIESVTGCGVSSEDVLVVDNASHDSSAEELRAAFPSIRVLELADNGGYAVGMNAGIREWRGRDVLLLTHDCVLEPNAIDALRQRLACDPSIGVVGPLLGVRSAREKVWSAGGTFRPPARISHRGFGSSLADWIGQPPARVEWLDGACLLIRSDVIDAIGGFDESYFLYFEETDYLFRVRKEGWEICCDPSALAWQDAQARPEALYVRNRLVFLWRDVSWSAACRQGMHEVRRILRLSISRNGSARAQGAGAARGLVGAIVGTSPRDLYETSRGR